MTDAEASQAAQVLCEANAQKWLTCHRVLLRVLTAKNLKKKQQVKDSDYSMISVRVV